MTKKHTKDKTEPPKRPRRARLTRGALLLWWSEVVRDETRAIQHRLRASQLLGTAYGMLTPKDTEDDKSVKEAVKAISKARLKELQEKAKQLINKKDE
jgi:hypothetical protein